MFQMRAFWGWGWVRGVDWTDPTCTGKNHEILRGRLSGLEKMDAVVQLPLSIRARIKPVVVG